jgi:hypothetical protein
MEIGFLCIHAPIVSCLVSYLTPLDWMCLARALPLITRRFPYRKTLNKLARTHLLTNLTAYFGGQEDVAQFILENLGTHYAITGGFLLAAITGDLHFMEADLDVIHVIHQRVGPCLEDKLVQRGWLAERSPRVVNRYDRFSFRNLSSVMDYTLFEKHFQVLHVHFDKDYVKGFDLAFCRNYYNDMDGLVVYFPESIIHRRCSINLEKAHFKELAPREIDYKASSVEKRIIKYRARGYAIRIEPGMSNATLCAFLTSKRRKDDQEGLANDAQEWNLFWANKR